MLQSNWETDSKYTAENGNHFNFHVMTLQR
jgi:hypothetical protein